jgi:hypothetical protein
VPLRQPFIHRRRHQKAGVAINRAEIAHLERGALPKAKRIRVLILNSSTEPC